MVVPFIALVVMLRVELNVPGDVGLKVTLMRYDPPGVTVAGSDPVGAEKIGEPEVTELSVMFVFPILETVSATVLEFPVLTEPKLMLLCEREIFAPAPVPLRLNVLVPTEL